MILNNKNIAIKIKRLIFSGITAFFLIFSVSCESSEKAENPKIYETATVVETVETSVEISIAEQNFASADYIANANTKKFHYPTCSSVDLMNEENKIAFVGNRDELIEQGYKPCKRCEP